MTKSLNNQKIPSEQLEEYLHRLERKVRQLTLAYRETKVLFQKEINQHQQTEAALQKANQELQKANQELQRLATTDGLTQVANRRRFDEYLSLEWRRLTRSQAPLSLILCDVDFFKSYNDTYGHLAGDSCLRAVAQAIKGALKRPADLVARYGGDELAVILPNTNAKGAVHVAEVLRHEVKRLKIPHASSKVNEYVTLSEGVSSQVPTQDLSPETLIAGADQALYQAKEQGRQGVVLKI